MKKKLSAILAFSVFLSLLFLAEFVGAQQNALAIEIVKITDQFGKEKTVFQEGETMNVEMKITNKTGNDISIYPPSVDVALTEDPTGDCAGCGGVATPITVLANNFITQTQSYAWTGKEGGHYRLTTSVPVQLAPADETLFSKDNDDIAYVLHGQRYENPVVVPEMETALVPLVAFLVLALIRFSEKKRGRKASGKA